MKNLRKEFPALERFVYLNTAASGLLSETLLDFRQNHDLDFLIGGSEFRLKEKNLLTETRETLALFFNADPDLVALLPSFSIGFNFLLEGIPENSKVLLLKNDYPSINLAVENRAFEISYAQIDGNLEENVLQAIHENQPEIFIFSLVQYINGIKIDFDFLKGLKQRFPELILIADGTQYLGTEEFDFKNSGLDVVGASAYKWLNAGYGNGFFLFSEKAASLYSPKATGYGSNIGKYKSDERNFIGKFEPGHLDTLNFGSLKAALELQSKIGQKEIQKQIEIFSKKAKNEFEKLDLLEESVVKRKKHSSIFNIRGDEKLLYYLRGNEIICSPRGKGIRISFHYFNTEKELDFLLKTLRKYTNGSRNKN
ncbi:MAG TPA: aminotransferase class V-fold PLP-dependent enzyme [Flavobacteriaceae bacterium]|nr:aminotransferase class V-fold PLP-dependent enzyme [Flavobacteriaceae bacterium]